VSGLRKFILSADWHCVQTRPAARLDPDWKEAQRQALRFLTSQAVKHSCPLVAVGDLFDHPKVGTEIVNMVIEEMNALRSQGQEFYLIAGNHDLEGHLATNAHKCSVGTLLNIFPRIPNIPGVQSAPHFGEGIDPEAAIVFTHQLVFKDEDSRPPMAKGVTSQELLDSLPSAKWVFVGDLHHSYDYQAPDGRHVVSPGNLLAHNASMIEVEAKCALIDLDSTTAPVTWISIPDDPTMLTRDHLDAKAERKERFGDMMAYVKDTGKTIVKFVARLDVRMGMKDIPESRNRAYLVVKAQATVEEK